MQKWIVNHQDLGEKWCDRITGTTRQKYFNEFLKLYKLSYDREFDNYTPGTRSYHLENFKAHCMWTFRHFKKDGRI